MVISTSLKDRLWPLIRRARRPYFGTWASTEPLSRAFGYDRGTPVGRYYIETFLAHRSSDIRGRVLEIGEDAYSRRFGGDVKDPAYPVTITVRARKTT